MPFAVTTFNLPCGTLATCADGSGVITGEEAEILVKRFQPGGANFGLPLLVLTQQMSKMTGEARQLISRSNDPSVPKGWCAVVVTNPLIRVTLNFLMRVSGSADSVKLFTSEPEAIRWMDERVRVAGPTVPAQI